MRADWVECTFEDVFELITNGSSIKQTDDKNGIPVSRIETIWNETIDWSRVKYAIDYDDNLHNKYLLKNGDILFSHINSDSHLGKTAIFKDFKKLIHGINLLLLRPFSILNSTYILYYLRFTKYSGGFLQIAQRSVNQSSINQRSLKQLTIFLPPLPEQRAIVKKIEALFSSLDAGIADLKKAQDQLKIYRQAVLKKAFEGELTKDQCYNWDEKTFEECTFNFNGKRVPLNKSTREKRKGKYRYFGATEIVDYIDDYIFDGKYLLIGEDGANLLTKSKPLAFIVEGKFWVNNHAHIVQSKDFLSIDYLSIYFNSLNINEYVTGTAQPKLNKFNLNKIPVKFPSELSQQAQIVKEIESRLSICDAVEQQIKDSLSQAEALRQSILKKAFEGKLLTEEEIKACQQAPDYEPAAVLLEKIKAEKEANKPNKKIKKK